MWNLNFMYVVTSLCWVIFWNNSGSAWEWNIKVQSKPSPSWSWPICSAWNWSEQWMARSLVSICFSLLLRGEATTFQMCIGSLDFHFCELPDYMFCFLVFLLGVGIISLVFVEVNITDILVWKFLFTFKKNILNKNGFIIPIVIPILLVSSLKNHFLIKGHKIFFMF